MLELIYLLFLGTVGIILAAAAVYIYVFLWSSALARVKPEGSPVFRAIIIHIFFCLLYVGIFK